MKISPQNLAESLRQFIAEKRSMRVTLQEEKSALIQRMGFLNNAPVADDDLQQFFCDYVDQRAESYAEIMRGTISLFSNPRGLGATRVDAGARPGHAPPANWADIKAALSGDLSGVFGIGGEPKVWTADQGFFQADNAACYFMGDEIKDRVRAEFKKLKERHPLSSEELASLGPSLDERSKELGAIEERLFAIDAEVAEIDAAINEIMRDPAQEDADRRTNQERSATLAREDRDRQIRRDYNGRNEEELARRFGIPVNEAKAIGSRY